MVRYATWLRSQIAGPLSRAQQYRRAVVMADGLVSELDSSDALQVYGMLHLSAALAAAAQADRGTCAIAVESSEPGDVVELARAVEVEAIPSANRRAGFYLDVGRSLLGERVTREAGVATLMAKTSAGSSADPYPSQPVDVAVEFVARQLRGPERILDRHYATRGGICAGCSASPTTHPCQAARVAVLAQQHPAHLARASTPRAAAVVGSGAGT